MSSVNFTVDSADLVANLETKNVGNYFTAHDADEASETITHGAITVGQKYNLSYNLYSVYRGALCFDTSGLDDSALIKSAYLTLDSNNTDVVIYLKSGAPTYPHIPAEAGDYDIDHYSGNGGSANLKDNNYTLNLNATGLGWISKTEYTKFIVLSENDINREAPTGTEYVQFGGYEHPMYDNAKLTVEYYIPSSIPVVGDPTFSNTKGTYTKATANVSDDGGGYEERGFEYGLSEEATWATRETGVFTGTGNYSQVINGLLLLTKYYVRAYVTNDYGTGYSDWTSFTTTDVPSYGIYEESNSPTICFYVRRAGGKWSIKHGPYTTDQADIEIGKILTEGKGKYQIKFTSDVLTGLSVNIMTKLDIRAR